MLYPSKMEAYEALEDVHEAVFGFRKYSEYDSFRYAMKVRKQQPSTGPDCSKGLARLTTENRSERPIRGVSQARRYGNRIYPMRGN